MAPYPATPNRATAPGSCITGSSPRCSSASSLVRMASNTASSTVPNRWVNRSRPAVTASGDPELDRGGTRPDPDRGLHEAAPGGRPLQVRTGRRQPVQGDPHREHRQTEAGQTLIGAAAPEQQPRASPQSPVAAKGDLAGIDRGRARGPDIAPRRRTGRRHPSRRRPPGSSPGDPRSMRSGPHQPTGRRPHPPWTPSTDRPDR